MCTCACTRMELGGHLTFPFFLPPPTTHLGPSLNRDRRKAVVAHDSLSYPDAGRDITSFFDCQNQGYFGCSACIMAIKEVTSSLAALNCWLLFLCCHHYSSLPVAGAKARATVSKIKGAVLIFCRALTSMGNENNLYAII